MGSNNELEISFEMGTIDHLGVKLYSTIPPMISELISNAWDADAHKVYIDFNDGDNKSISVRDDGTGMDFDELNDKFLKIGRNRRIDTGSDRSDEGRPVLGKKGLGKLSMFGIGKRITVTTVKNGIRNSFIMDYDDIKKCSQEGTYKPELIDMNQSVNDSSGTEIKIENLGRKSAFDLEGLKDSLQARFHIFSNDFIVDINNGTYIIDSPLMESDKYQFCWEFPKDFEADKSKFQPLYDFGISKKITGKVFTAPTPLRKELQGIVLFSRGKLVQENKTFNERGNDNFFQYMTGSFDVDFIDEVKEIDNCSTDRKSLAWDTFGNDELVALDGLMTALVDLSQSKWREARKSEKKKKISAKVKDVDKWLKSLTEAERPLAKKLMSAIVDNNDIDDEDATMYVGYIQDMYGFTSFQDFTAKLDSMDQLGNENAIKLLTDWDEIEAKEFAKISIGRIKTIEQFDKFVKSDASERDVIQKFLEEFPWLLDPKMSKFEREVTYTKLLKENFSDESDLPESNRRLDFLCTNSAGVIHVIELKRPSIKLRTKEIQQIAEYVEFIENHFPQTHGNVKGYLISDNMTFEPGAEKTRKGLESVNIFVKSYSDLLAEARRYNQDLYDSYEAMRKQQEHE